METLSKETPFMKTNLSATSNEHSYVTVNRSALAASYIVLTDAMVVKNRIC